MQEIGEELIDIDENNKSNKKENDTKKSDKIKNKYKFFFILLIVILTAIIIIYSFLKKMNNKRQFTSLIIFDFDKTITEKDTYEEQLPLLNSKEAEDELFRRIYEENWAAVMAETYDRFYELNISIDDINKYIDKVKIVFGMKELFNFLKNQKDKYFLVIFSAGHLYQVNRVLQTNNLTSFFDEVIAFFSYEKNGRIIINKTEEINCDRCKGIGQCKTNEFNLLKKKYEEKNIYFDKIYYICDGINDFCLARNLNKTDELLIRKEFSLDKYLYNKGYIKNIKCNIYKWNNGFDIINFFKNKKN